DGCSMRPHRDEQSGIAMVGNEIGVGAAIKQNRNKRGATGLRGNRERRAAVPRLAIRVGTLVQQQFYNIEMAVFSGNDDSWHTGNTIIIRRQPLSQRRLNATQIAVTSSLDQVVIGQSHSL